MVWGFPQIRVGDFANLVDRSENSCKHGKVSACPTLLFWGDQVEKICLHTRGILAKPCPGGMQPVCKLLPSYYMGKTPAADILPENRFLHVRAFFSIITVRCFFICF
jgi:hypothetical protein